MRAVGYNQSLPIENPESLQDIELPVPTPVGRQLLVRVEAVSVNPVDTKIRKRVTPDTGSYQVLGWDAAGVVEAVGEDVSLFQPGDQVWYAGAIDKPGCNAERHLVDERIVARKPANLDFAQAAAMPLTTITAWEILFDRIQVARDRKDALLVIGGAGGVGSMLIQLAKQLTDLTVIATASRPHTRAWVEKLGADLVLDHSRPLDRELQAAGIESVRYIASLTQTDQHLPAIVNMIAPQGAMAVIDDPAVLDIMPFKRKSIAIHWELMFTRSLFGTEDMIEQHRLLTEVAQMVEQGRLQSTVAENFGVINATNLRRAHQLLEAGKACGKIVLNGFY